MDPRAILIADDDERRSLERALHDSVQQRLIALAIELQLARGSVDREPEEAVRMLEEARIGVAQVLDEIRAVAQRIHPPLLDSHGLVAALRMAGAAAPLPTRVDGTVDEPVPPEAAVTVYRCCVAALSAVQGTNGSATVAVATTDGMLTFRVDVAGGQVDVASVEPAAGRVRLLGGTIDVAPTRVDGGLPLMPHRPRPGT